MSLALSSAADEVIQRTITIPTEEFCLPVDVLNLTYSLNSCANWINQNGFKRIALQFPDILLRDSVSIARCVEQLTQQKIFILGDTSYGSCCVDEIAAEHGACDAIIHFGHSCLSPTGRLPVGLVLPSPRDFDLHHFSVAFAELVAQVEKDTKVVILYDTSYFAVLDSIEKLLPANFSISPLILPEGQTVIFGDACLRKFISVDNQTDHHVISHRLLPFRKNQLSGATFLYIGPSSPCMTNLFLRLSSSPFYSYDPKQKLLSLESSKINKRIMQRYYLIERAKDARIVGILIGTLGVKGYLEIIDRLKKIITSAGKRFYTFSMGKPNPAKLANFMEIDVFVYVACSESEFNSKEYLKPIVTPHEMEIACGQHPIDADFVADFRDLLPGGEAHGEIQKVELGAADVSLITGSARVMELDDQRQQDGSSQELVRHERILTVSTQLSAGDFLASRSWKGLEPHYGQNSPSEIVEGRHGIALSYNSETVTDQSSKDCTTQKDGCCGNSCATSSVEALNHCFGDKK